MHNINALEYIIILPALIGMSNPLYTWLMLGATLLVGFGIGQYYERRKQ